jgi:hypothetical protein
LSLFSIILQRVGFLNRVGPLLPTSLLVIFKN